MNLKQLQQMYPDATKETWHKHKNGGGWVENTAYVNINAYIGRNAQVFGDARVSGNAQVFGDAWNKSPLQIIGSYGYTVCQSDNNKITVGCECHSYDIWIQNGEEILSKHSSNTEGINEYMAHIMHIVNCTK